MMSEHEYINETHTCSDGGKYQGETKNGKHHGHGTKIYPNGAKYEGNWFEGKRNGKGIMTYSNDDKYIGEFKDGKPSGFGEILFNDGSCFRGYLKDGQRHGKGTIIFPNGTIIIAEFEEDEQIYGEEISKCGKIIRSYYLQEELIEEIYDPISEHWEVHGRNDNP